MCAHVCTFACVCGCVGVCVWYCVTELDVQCANIRGVAAVVVYACGCIGLHVAYVRGITDLARQHAAAQYCMYTPDTPSLSLCVMWLCQGPQHVALLGLDAVQYQSW